MIQRRFDRQSKGCASQCYITFGTHSFKCAGARIGSRFNARMRMRGSGKTYKGDVRIERKFKSRRPQVVLTVNADRKDVVIIFV